MSKKITVLVNGYGSNEEPREFEILSRSEIEAIIDDLSTSDVYGKAFREARGWQASGAVTVYLDARTGELASGWLGNNNFNHPFDSFYEIDLATIKTGCGDTELNEEHLLEDPERKEYREANSDSYVSIEDWITVNHGAEELEDRIGYAIDSFAADFELDDCRIREQLDDLYARQVTNA